MINLRKKFSLILASTSSRVILYFRQWQCLELTCGQFRRLTVERSHEAQAAHTHINTTKLSHKLFSIKQLSVLATKHYIRS